MFRRVAPPLRAVVAALAISQAALPLSVAQESRTLEVEVVDPSAYLKEGRHGPDMVEQTYEAVDGGQTLALLDEKTGALYVLLAEEPGEDPNELVYDYVNQKITVTGTLYARSGVNGIVVTSVQGGRENPQAAAGAPAHD